MILIGFFIITLQLWYIYLTIYSSWRIKVRCSLQICDYIRKIMWSSSNRWKNVKIKFIKNLLLFKSFGGIRWKEYYIQDSFMNIEGFWKWSKHFLLKQHDTFISISHFYCFDVLIIKLILILIQLKYVFQYHPSEPLLENYFF